MRTKELTFNGVVFYINDLLLDSERFQNKVTSGEYKESLRNKINILNLEYENQYLKIKLSDGSSLPRNPSVYNQETEKFEENPRGKHQIEPKEYYAVLDLSNSYLWLTNTAKKKVLTKFFQTNFFKQTKICLKDVYNEESFVKQLKEIDQIRISAAPGIFSNTHTLSQALTDEMYGACEATLSLKYDKKNKFKVSPTKWFKSILDNRQAFKNITISGRDEKNLGMMFSTDLFLRKIDINVSVDEFGMFNAEEVFENFIATIEDEKRQIK